MASLSLSAGAGRLDLKRLLLDQIEDIVAGVAMVVVIGSVLWGVLTRYVFPQPAAWSYEVATIGFAWLVFFGAAGGVRYRLHSDIDVLVAYFPEQWQRAVAIFNYWLVAVFFAALAVFFVIHSIDAHGSVTIALNLPRSVIYAPLAVATALMLVRHVQVWRNPDRFVAGAVREANIT
jgi:TRAP-type C4-dicarboxylate transport system permease small subunit